MTKPHSTTSAKSFSAAQARTNAYLYKFLLSYARNSTGVTRYLKECSNAIDAFIY